MDYTYFHIKPVDSNVNGVLLKQSKSGKLEVFAGEGENLKKMGVDLNASIILAKQGYSVEIVSEKNAIKSKEDYLNWKIQQAGVIDGICNGMGGF